MSNSRGTHTDFVSTTEIADYINQCAQYIFAEYREAADAAAKYETSPATIVEPEMHAAARQWLGDYGRSSLE